MKIWELVYDFKEWEEILISQGATFYFAFDEGHTTLKIFNGGMYTGKLQNLERNLIKGAYKFVKEAYQGTSLSVNADFEEHCNVLLRRGVEEFRMSVSDKVSLYYLDKIFKEGTLEGDKWEFLGSSLELGKVTEALKTLLN